MKSKFLKRLKTLLVEDEESLSSLLKDAIGDNFYSFYTAENGKKGLEKFLEISPDIIITDIMMPDMSGLEMAREIRKIDPNVPVIILSAFSETDNFLDAIDVGVVKYFIKPFDPDELLEYIESLEPILESKIITLKNGFVYNKVKNTLYKNTRYVKLSKKESEFFKLLMQNYEDDVRVVSDEIIKQSLWVGEDVSDERLRTFIRRLRVKTSKDLVQNIKGEGYQII
jgi:DNA-binding response OmpR family regulator